VKMRFDRGNGRGGRGTVLFLREAVSIFMSAR
jgi:hypothetical protein